MTAVNTLLDKYREICSFNSDSAVAESLGIKRQGVHQWRKGTAWPSEQHIDAMAKKIQEPTERWLAQIAMDRAPQQTKKYWLRLLQTAATVAGIYILSRIDGQTGTLALLLPAAHSSGTLYIMSIIE